MDSGDSMVEVMEQVRQVQKTGHATEIFLRNITRVLPQYVFWKDVNSVYLGCNKNYASLVGLSSPEEIIGKTDDDLNWQPLGHTSEMFKRGDKETILGNPITNQEEVLVFPDGKTMITLVSKLPILDQGGVIGIVGYFTDITELKNKENELIKAKKQAESANEAKSVFMTNISHDIRTPLTGMIGTAKILYKEIKTDQGKEAARNLFSAANVLLDVLNEVIEVTKLASADMPVYDVKFNMRRLIDGIFKLVRPSAHEKNLAFHVDYDQSIPTYLIGDQRRIHRIVLNLVSNAVRFTSKGQVRVEACLSKEEGRDVVLKIMVRDTGVGIAPADQQIIFSRFTRLDVAYKNNHKGSV